MAWTSQFVLENEKGERYDLTAPAPVFLVNVKGLGIVTSRTFGSLGNGFFVTTSDEVPTNPITGDLVYYASAFENYENLVNWIGQAKTMFFCYSPLNAEFRCRVRLNYINKDRRDGGGVMRAAVSFHPLTPWYQPEETAATIDMGGPNAKAYLEHNGEYYYTYDDDLVYGPETPGDPTKTIYPAGHEPSGLLIRYTGAVVNPVVKLTGVSGTVYGECHIDETFTAGQTLELCTAPDNSYVHKISGGIVTDLMAASKIDLAFEPYPRAPVDEASVLTITGDDPVQGEAEVTIYRYYRSV